MAYIPYADLAGADQKPLVQQIVAERGSVLHLYQMLLHSPPIAEGWLKLLTAVRLKSDLPGALRELVIMRVAVLNGAAYEAEQHAPIALREGITQQQIDALGDWEGSPCFTPFERNVLRLTDTMTTQVKVPRNQIDVLRAGLGDRQLVELVTTVASYNMVSRFLEALDIHSTDRSA